MKGVLGMNLKIAGNVGLLLAGVWLLLFGVLLAFPAVQFSNWNVVVGLMGFLTGVLVVVDRLYQPTPEADSKT